MTKYDRLSDHPLHVIWRGMIARCHYPTNKAFPAYGARGIAVCDRWRGDLYAFAADMGPRPSAQHSVDRIDNNGNYEPANCRWATPTEQSRNRRSRPEGAGSQRALSSGNRLLEWQGETLPMAQWAARKGLPAYVVWQRLEVGWTIERALSEPKHKYDFHRVQGRTLGEWARCLGVRPMVLYARVKRGWSLDRAIATPPRQINRSGGAS